MNKKKVIIGVGVLLALGTVAFFGFRKNGWFRKKEDEENPFDTIGGGSSSGGSSSGGSSSGGSSSGGSSSGSSSSGSSTGPYNNPIGSKSEVLKFQQFVIYKIGDRTILGKGGASGYGDDGIWGQNTKKAWDKYSMSYLLAI